MAFLSKVAIRTSLLGPRGLNWEMRRCGQRLKASGCDGRGYCQGGSHQSKVSGWMNGWFGACNVGAIQGFWGNISNHRNQRQSFQWETQLVKPPVLFSGSGSSALSHIRLITQNFPKQIGLAWYALDRPTKGLWDGSLRIFPFYFQASTEDCIINHSRWPFLEECRIISIWKSAIIFFPMCRQRKANYTLEVEATLN